MPWGEAGGYYLKSGFRAAEGIHGERPLTLPAYADFAVFARWPVSILGCEGLGCGVDAEGVATLEGDDLVYRIETVWGSTFGVYCEGRGNVEQKI